MKKCIIIDNVADNFQRQPENGIFIKSWYDDMGDTALTELCPLLKQIVLKKYEDVRDALSQFRVQMKEKMEQGQ